MARHPVQWLRANPLTADALLALAVGTGSLLGLLSVDPEDFDASNRDSDLLGVLLVVGVCAAVAFRRRYPEAMAWLGTALIIPYWVLDYVDTGASIAVLALIYSLAAHVERHRALRVGLVIGGVLVAVMIAGVVAEQEDLPAITVVGNVVIFATAWTIGDGVRSRQAYLAEVEARAERAELDRELATERAVQEERVRIARELHDVVAHSVSVMVVQAGAARRVLERRPDQAAESLAVVESTGRNALDELRRVLGVLRAEDANAATTPQPSAEDVAALVDQWRDTGLDVDLAVVGTPPPLAPGVSLTVYRVVQEALTNAYKHAGPAHVDVVVQYGAEDGAIAIEVIDDGRGPAGSATVPSAGQGLIGMRERVELFGGDLRVGARAGGGFRVRATVPAVPSAVA